MPRYSEHDLDLAEEFLLRAVQRSAGRGLVAGEELNAGDWVVIGPDGRAYRAGGTDKPAPPADEPDEPIVRGPAMDGP